MSAFQFVATMSDICTCVRSLQFGEVGVDDALVKRRVFGEEDIVEMNNGCICCTVRGTQLSFVNSDCAVAITNYQ